jgi:hypothetical protein
MMLVNGQWSMVNEEIHEDFGWRCASGRRTGKLKIIQSAKNSRLNILLINIFYV